ncbi:hypothetical protein [Ruegeria arenilitoris]|uniref:hypothetical protein n=1 Tax=Ruegeria arenilitoris TaxID=1173585 RepID=UPI00147CE78D|nr:hypothetical protein [Ruegeria arenilitoris]
MPKDPVELFSAADIACVADMLFPGQPPRAARKATRLILSLQELLKLEEFEKPTPFQLQLAEKLTALGSGVEEWKAEERKRQKGRRGMREGRPTPSAGLVEGSKAWEWAKKRETDCGILTCPVCSATFDRRRPNQKYCSDGCRNRAHYAAKDAETKSTP